MSNVSPDNVLVSSAQGAPLGAVWDSEDVLGGGRVAILMDVNWAQDGYRDATTPLIVQNIATFLAAR